MVDVSQSWLFWENNWEKKTGSGFPTVELCCVISKAARFGPKNVMKLLDVVKIPSKICSFDLFILAYLYFWLTLLFSSSWKLPSWEGEV